METVLKNGKTIKLEVTPLILEYIEDYEGGMEKLLLDSQAEKDEYGYTRSMYAVNHILYAIIASNYEEELTYRQAVRLVQIEDVEKIVNFTKQEIEKIKIEEKPLIEKGRHRM